MCSFAGENPVFEVSKKKAQSLGINFIPFEVSFKDTVESFVEKGFLNFWKCDFETKGLFY